MGVDRKKIHRLVDEIPDGDLGTAESFLEWLLARKRDPVLRSMDEAPEEYETISQEEEEAVREAREAVERGEVLSAERARKLLGL